MAIEEPALGRLLRRLRATMGLTQEELAERAGISARTVSDVERGLRSAIYRETADRLADALHLTDADRQELQRIGRARRAPRTTVAASDAKIPRAPTPILGRETEIATIGDALRSREARILVVTGPGGIGKTRLAIEIAGLHERDFTDGALFVDLAGTFEPRLVPAVLAEALGIPQRREPLEAAIIEHLRKRNVLLILDTFEHLIGAAPLVAELSSACEGVTTLITSRAPMRVRGEREFPIGPLTISGDHPAPMNGRPGPALALFVDRAHAIRPDLPLDSESAEREVAAICRRLDGIPLAIELAAARVRHLPLAGLREALDLPLDVLTDGPRDVPDRQRSMRHTVAWSYELLARGDQKRLRELSIFAGGWSRDAARLVTVRDGAADAFAGMTRLIDHSLVSVAASTTDVLRYRMLDVIREFAAEQRDAAGETESLFRRHAEYFVMLAEAEEPHLLDARQASSAQALAAESDNFRQALRWSLSRGKVEIALRLAGALWQFWRLRADLVEGRAWLDEALRLPHQPEDARGKALWGAAWLALHQGDFDRSEALGEELHNSAEEAGDALGRRNGLTVLAKVATARGRHAEAVARCQAALEACRDLDPSWHLATSIFNLGTALLHDGDHGRAEALFVEAVERYRKLGDERFVARVTGYVGYPALLRGEIPRARESMMRSFRAFVDIDDAWGIAEALERLSALAAASGKAMKAAEIAGAAARMRENILIEPMQEEETIIAPYLDNAKMELGEPQWQQAFERGRQLSLEDVRSGLAAE